MKHQQLIIYGLCQSSLLVNLELVLNRINCKQTHKLYSMTQINQKKLFREKLF